MQSGSNKKQIINKEQSCLESIAEFTNWLKQIRRTIHQNPELAFHEEKTSAFIRSKLSELGVENVTEVGKTGLVVIIPGSGLLEKGVALRADMDALPLQEDNEVSYRSQTPGIMHACGHDGHVAMLLGAIAILLSEEQLPGDVYCIFQPAEESGCGAKSLVAKRVLDPVDGVFSGHIDTHFDTGAITVDEGIICAFADPFVVKIKGRGGHAARPHEAADAVVAASSLVTIIQTLVSRETDPNNSAVVTVGSFQAGKVHNVIADEAILEGTIRSTDVVTREKTMNGLRRIVQSVGDMYSVSSSVEFLNGLPAVMNSEDATRVAQQSAMRIVGRPGVISQGRPSLGGEDFAFYQQVVDGCMVRFGARQQGGGPAHSSTYDFDEEALLVGARWFSTVAKSWLLREKNNVG